MESLEEQIDLLKRIVTPNQGKENLPADISRVEKIIKEEIPNALEKQAPANFPELYFDFEYVYSRFYDFLLFDTVLFGVFLKVDIVQQTHNAPVAGVLAEAQLICVPLHYALNRQTVHDVKRLLVVLFEQFKRRVSCN